MSRRSPRDNEAIGDLLFEVERELRQLATKADRLQDTLGELVACAGDRLDHAAIEETQAIDLISQRLTRLARTVARAAAALGASPIRAAPPPRPPAAGEFERF